MNPQKIHIAWAVITYRYSGKASPYIPVKACKLSSGEYEVELGPSRFRSSHVFFTGPLLEAFSKLEQFLHTYGISLIRIEFKPQRSYYDCLKAEQSTPDISIGSDQQDNGNSGRTE